MNNPELPLSGTLSHSLEELRAVTGDIRIRDLMESQRGRAPLHVLVQSGLRGIEVYLDEEQVAAESEEVVAQRSLALLDAALSSATTSPECSASLSVQAGFQQLRGCIDDASRVMESGESKDALRELSGILRRDLDLGDPRQLDS
ncbi:MAG: hypothetical protein AAGJ31_05755 [Verrucomicrobiota bacterium]